MSWICMIYLVFDPQLVICLHESYENWVKLEILKKHWIKKHNLKKKARENLKASYNVHTNTLFRDREYPCMIKILVKTCLLNSQRMYSNFGNIRLLSNRCAQWKASLHDFSTTVHFSQFYCTHCLLHHCNQQITTFKRNKLMFSCSWIFFNPSAIIYI